MDHLPCIGARLKPNNTCIGTRTIQEQNMKCGNEPGTWTMKCVWWALHGISTMFMKSWAMVMDKSGAPIARGEMVVVMVVGAP